MAFGNVMNTVFCADDMDLENMVYVTEEELSELETMPVYFQKLLPAGLLARLLEELPRSKWMRLLDALSPEKHTLILDIYEFREMYEKTKHNYFDSHLSCNHDHMVKFVRKKKSMRSGDNSVVKDIDHVFDHEFDDDPVFPDIE